jgi:hypothetical protein
LVVNASKVNDNVIIVPTAKDKPRIAFVGDAALGNDREATLQKGAFNAVKFSELLLTPVFCLGAKQR